MCKNRTRPFTLSLIFVPIRVPVRTIQCTIRCAGLRIPTPGHDPSRADKCSLEHETVLGIREVDGKVAWRHVRLLEGQKDGRRTDLVRDLVPDPPGPAPAVLQSLDPAVLVTAGHDSTNDQWYESLKMPGSTNRCCGGSDCRPTEAELRGGRRQTREVVMVQDGTLPYY